MNTDGMTYEESKKQIIKLQNQLYKNWVGDIEIDADEHYEALDYAIEALENAEKYKWHDLRKNPNDLPKDDGHYVLAKTVGGYALTTAFLLNSRCTDYIAWKEISPLDEVIT